MMSDGTTTPFNPGQLLLQQFARIGHALSSPHRLKLMNLLSQGAKPVEWLAEQSGQTIASASAHLKVLSSACLVQSHRQGKYVYYSIASDAVPHLLTALRQVGEQQLPEAREVIRSYFDDPESLLRLSPQQVLEGVKEGQFTLLDVRPADEYAAGHVPHARSLPFADLEQHLKNIPKRQKIAVYCRGPYCVTALEAVSRLRASGLKAYRLPLGVTEWKAAGLKLETDSAQTR